VVALEHAELAPIRVDLDPSPLTDPAHDLFTLLLAGDTENEVAVRAGERCAARLAPYHLPEQSAQPFEVAISQRGTLDNLEVRPLQRREPGPGEVEIRVHATGLNFKDVLNCLGMYPGDPGPLGGECAGTVLAVGTGVTDLQPGDAVIALAPGGFRSHILAPAEFVVPKPAQLSFTEAAGLLIANVTADFALRDLGQMQPGERVLIHAAAGGVGLAAVQLAQRVGAKIFATAGSPAKRAFLTDLGVAHIYDSRSLDFADQIMADTDNEGVDLVLNSLAGDFVARSLNLLRQGGRFLEIGKRDHLSAEQARNLDRQLAYHVIDWGETARHEPQRIRRILSDTVTAVEQGGLQPLPTRIFPIDEVQAAFRYMAQAKHIGKIVVTQPEASLDRPEPAIRPDATYLISGGLRGLGWLTARRLVDRGARALALIGRSAPTSTIQAEIEQLERDGVQVAVCQGNVACRSDVEQVLARIEAELPPLRGIFHAAGLLEDGAIANQTWEQFETVLAPKVAGSHLLHELTEHMQIDYFVLYSSVAGLFGSPGQANHAAANAYLDSLAHQRRSRGLPALSINWGVWAEVGAAAERAVTGRAAQSGLEAMMPDEGLNMLEQLMQRSLPQVVVAPVRWSSFLQRFVDEPPRFYADLAAKVLPETRPTPADLPANRRQAIEDAPPHRRHDLLRELVIEHAAHVLALPAIQIDERMPLSELGLDSLMAVELRNVLGSTLGLTRPLPATLVFDYPTVAALTSYLIDTALELDTAAGEAAAPTTAGVTSAGETDITSMLDQLESLSDEEIDRLLAQGGQDA
jgi:NADPH:quinone reductase-like Zn-dependent oxidoreductase/NADP-dependent 3-hydroxy acid dehydrogenase YdfG/acyl carrier protein